MKNLNTKLLFQSVILGVLIPIAFWTASATEQQMSAPRLIREHGCDSCHIIPRINSATGRVGPSLEAFKSRVYIAGVIPNTKHNLELWLLDPTSITSNSAMPNTGLTEKQARVLSNFLLSD